jgi:hypothetical protein
MEWDGAERRQNIRFCEGHLPLIETLARIEERQIAMKDTVEAVDKRINGSINTIEKHIENSRGRNLTIALAFVGVIGSLITFAYGLGESKKQIEINTQRWDRLLNGRIALGNTTVAR